MCAEGSAMIRGKSRMREIRSYGSVRGVPGNRHPYRDPTSQRRERGARVPLTGIRLAIRTTRRGGHRGTPAASGHP